MRTLIMSTNMNANTKSKYIFVFNFDYVEVFFSRKFSRKNFSEKIFRKFCSLPLQNLPIYSQGKKPLGKPTEGLRKKGSIRLRIQLRIQLRIRLRILKEKKIEKRAITESDSPCNLLRSSKLPYKQNITGKNKYNKYIRVY